MTLDEFKNRAAKISDWAPGWEAIDSCLNALYHGKEPRHLATNMAMRAQFGGDQYLDGCSIYESANGHLHIVTYGMSELYVNEESFGGEWSKWGYEMTIRLPLCEEADYMWAIYMLGRLAHYTYTSKKFFTPMQYISGGGAPIKLDSDSKLTGLLIVEDPELPGVDTLYGRLDFLQLVGITQPELEALMSDINQAKVLIEHFERENPFFVTDLARTVSYLGI